MLKSSLILAAAVAMTASAAAADNSFGFGETLDNRATLDLGVVRSTSAGVVEIYDDANGELGRLLGTEAVNAGANREVQVNIGRRHNQDIIAVLKVNGQIVASKDYDLE